MRDKLKSLTILYNNYLEKGGILMLEFENGGAFAIKGFNFQKAAISLIAIKNYHKPNFHIFVEAKDDFEVKYDGYEAYIQVKSKKLSINQLLKSDKGYSILEKNLSNGNRNSHFKIFVKSFAETDIKKWLKCLKAIYVLLFIHIMINKKTPSLVNYRIKKNGGIWG